MINDDQSAEEMWKNASLAEDRGDISTAINLYEKSAKLNFAYSQNNLANIFDDKLVPSREKEAVYWYKKAISNGYSTAAWNLAKHYQNKGNKRWYRYWLERAVQMGDEDAIDEVKAH
jgi:TPR repeat protein